MLVSQLGGAVQVCSLKAEHSRDSSYTGLATERSSRVNNKKKLHIATGDDLLEQFTNLVEKTVN